MSDLPVADVARALGTSEQTVRTLLRNGELRGHKKPWGNRLVWAVDQEAVEEFLAAYGRLDGHRRPMRAEHTRDLSDRPADDPVPAPAPEPTPVPIEPTEADTPTLPPTGLAEIIADHGPQPYQRPWVLRPRGRATVVVVAVGIPLLLLQAAARLLPGALWFDELGQADVFRRLVAYRADYYLRVGAIVAVVIAANLLLTLRARPRVRSRVAFLVVAATSLVIGSLFAAAAEPHWQTFLLWRHRQPFGLVDPIHGKDIGFFVFSLPFYLQLANLLMWLLVVTAAISTAVYRARGTLGFRPLRATFEAQLHLAVLGAAFLVVVAWRLRLAQYLLELGQPSSGDLHDFAGAGYVDVHVRSPGLAALSGLALLLAGVCVALPFVTGRRYRRIAGVSTGVAATAIALGLALIMGLAPALVQKYLVEPNPLLSEERYLARSIAGTRAGLNLATISDLPYAPPDSFTAADFPAAEKRLGRVPVWDLYVLGERMRQLASEPAYYRPAEPELDIVKRGGRTQVTAVSARELDLSEVPDGGDSWASDRLSYTHGLGLLRFSSTDIAPNRQPRELDSSLDVEEPRIYYGNLTPSDDAAESAEPQLLTPTLDEHVAQSDWVLANTRRPEVDLPATDVGADPYHYTGSGGIAMSSWARRAVFALALGSKEILLSDDITDDSRLLLHRDVHDRLDTLAPFITWDSGATPLTADGHIVYVVDGYTTSANYPYAQRVDLAGTQVNYARASVVATVDAFSGEVRLYVTDDADPIITAWQEIFPTLFLSADQIPAELRDRLRYPADLFFAQANAYETFHVTSPDQYVSQADVWSRPLALSGPIEVAGDVDFDQDDEDDLRLTMPPVYIYSPPPGQADPRLVLATYYSPRGSQNLVASLSGWIDEDGRPQLGARTLSRESITLGPAQVSRLVFASPRVRNLLGLRNLEIRDLDISSLDSVLLGRPRLVFLDDGLVQLQNLYEGSRGPGAARLLGVTAFVNGRAGLGPDVKSAVRQALNEPPGVEVIAPPNPVIVDQPAMVSFDVENARREIVTIIGPDGRDTKVRTVDNGRGSVSWTPSEAGPTVVRVRVIGLDGTEVRARTTIRVLNTPPSLKLFAPTRDPEVGQPVRVMFRVENALKELVSVSTLTGVVYERRFEIRDGDGFIAWTPRRDGPAVLRVRAIGRDGQAIVRTLRLSIAPRQTTIPPDVTFVRLPEDLRVGTPTLISFDADNCETATARINGPDGVSQTWRFACPADPAAFTWTPDVPGRYRLTATARGGETTAQASIILRVGAGR